MCFVISPAFDLSDVTLELKRRLEVLQVDLPTLVGVQDLLLEVDDLADLRLDEVGVEVLLLDQLLGVDLQSSRKSINGNGLLKRKKLKNSNRE